MEQALVQVIHENPESTILIERVGELETIRIDVGEYGEFDTDTGEDLTELNISSRERERRKRRKDVKLKLKNAGMKHIREVYAISRINEKQETESKTVTKDVQEQQRDRRSPGS